MAAFHLIIYGRFCVITEDLDATAQAEYLYQCIEETIHRDLRDEIEFLAIFDAALRSALNIVDMPNRRASLLVRFILQNKGRLFKGKRATFSEISDQEIDRIEKRSGERGKMPILLRFQRTAHKRDSLVECV